MSLCFLHQSGQSLSDHQRPLAVPPYPDSIAITSPDRSVGRRPSQPSVRVRCPRLTRLLGLVLLGGLTACGSPSPDAPVSSQTTGSADAADAPRARLAAHEPTRQARMQTTSLETTTQQASTTGARITDASRTTNPVSIASPVNTPQPDAPAAADQAHYEARQEWLAELREHPVATVRLQALELWAQQPGDDIEPMLEALGDDDEQVQARAEELWEQQFTREETEQ